MLGGWLGRVHFGCSRYTGLVDEDGHGKRHPVLWDGVGNMDTASELACLWSWNCSKKNLLVTGCHTNVILRVVFSARRENKDEEDSFYEK